MTEPRLLDPAGRLVAAAVAAGCLGVLLIAAGLSVDPEGHGTHEQLGLPACGWAAMLDAPCPTCGMTTSFTAFADADPARAFFTQPLGAALALLTAAAFWASAWAAASGQRIGAMFGRLVRPSLLWGGGVAAGAAWAFKALTW